MLLLHGLGKKKLDWIEPDWDRWNFDHQTHPSSAISRDQPTFPLPEIFPEVTRSGSKPVKSWKDFLCEQGHTVIAYSQDGPEEKIETALLQFTSTIVPYVREKVLTGKLAWKKVTVLSHSRGGLLIRKYLHDVDANESGRWLERVITLHSPHHGSSISYFDNVIAELTGALLGVLLTNPIGKLILISICDNLFGNFLGEGANELEPLSSLIQELNTDVSPNPDIEFHTFGGTSVTLFRIYCWVYTPASYIPVRGDWWNPFTWRWDWESVPCEIPLISPLLDSLPNFIDEITQGKGDMLTSEERTKLKFAAHQSNPLNHAECLWDPGLFAQVSNILDTPVIPHKEVVLTINMNGQGSITPQPGSYTYGHPEQVTATAVSELGWIFDHWDGDIPDASRESRSITITMDCDKDVTACFKETPVFNLSIEAIGDGATYPRLGIHPYNEGTPVSIDAKDTHGWRFDHWEGALTGGENPATIIMDGDKSVAACFQKTFKLTMAHHGTGSTEPEIGAYTFDEGTSVSIDAKDTRGWRFDHWEGALTGGENPATVIMDSDKLVIACFHKIYIANRNSMEIHEFNCFWVTQMKDSNKMPCSGLGEVAELIRDRGYNGCFHCLPQYDVDYTRFNVSKLRASDGALIGTYNVGRFPYGICFDGQNIWVANYGGNNVSKLRASDGALIGTYNVGSSPNGICFDGQNIWVVSIRGHNVSKLFAGNRS